MAGRRAAAAAGLGMALAAGLGGCAHRRRPPPPPPPPIRYVLEPSWQVGDQWFYPHETFSLDTTGIAAVIGPGHPALTTDNESYDPMAMAAAMATVQLPAIATVTNLENGRQVAVRINDRGPVDPARLIAVTPRVAALLGFAGPAVRVRVRFDPDRSAALAHQVQGHSADLAIAAAPRGDVRQSDLAPLAGTTQAAIRRGVQGVAVPQANEAAAITVKLRLPEQVTQGYADPGALMIEAGTFTHEDAARRRLAAIPDAQARLARARIGGQTTISVRAGPFADLAEAEATLDRLRRDGVTDARIVVDLP